MDARDTYDHAFNTLIAESEIDPNGVESRVCSMSVDMRMVMAMSDVLLAAVTDFEDSEYRHNYGAACEVLADVVGNLRHEYGLSEPDAARAADYARINLQNSPQDLG